MLLVFVSRTAGQDPAVAEILRQKLQDELVAVSRDFNPEAVTRDRNVILVIVPERLMNFEIGKSMLRPEGEAFLKRYVPVFAEVLCSDAFRSSIESIVVEGHTDTQQYLGRTAEESEGLNLKLSQDRSMEVVKSALSELAGMNERRSCFLEKLSATGRGEQDQEPNAPPEHNRRVIFKIRVKVIDAQTLKVAGR